MVYNGGRGGAERAKINDFTTTRWVRELRARGGRTSAKEKRPHLSCQHIKKEPGTGPSLNDWADEKERNINPKKVDENERGGPICIKKKGPKREISFERDK